MDLKQQRFIKNNKNTSLKMNGIFKLDFWLKVFKYYIVTMLYQFNILFL